MLKRLNLIGLYVTDLQATVDFYRQLGFQESDATADPRSAAYVALGEIRLQFIAKDSASDKPESFQKDAFGEPKGTGVYLNIEVDAVDDLYHELIAKGLHPSSAPRDWPWGQREFVLRDPDGYKLVCYSMTG